jgi:hypothetical protein
MPRCASAKRRAALREAVPGRQRVFGSINPESAQTSATISIAAAEAVQSLVGEGMATPRDAIERTKGILGAAARVQRMQ